MVKRVFTLFSIFFFCLSFSQVKWLSMEKALQLQSENPKKIFIQFYETSCKACKKMDQTTYLNPQIQEYINKHYYPVKFNIKSTENIQYKGQEFQFNSKSKLHDFALYMNVNLSPSMVFLDEKANPITILQGGLTAIEINPYLHFFATDKHLKIKTKKDWENYLLKFKARMKD
ncbi:MAG: thioredoxin family protein [Flavobacteriales bacterium]|nr:MAG: thioredoxin family protein [Flavobacteriales bacterium]